MTSPRVMQLVLSLSPGGTERLVIDICRRLSARIAFTVCCLDQPGAWAAELAPLAIPVVALGRRPGFHPALALAIARLMRARGIDVLHCHHYSPYVYGLLASCVQPARLVFTEHGRLSDGEPSLKRRLVNPVLSRLPGRICAVSSELRRHMIAEGFPARRVRVVHNGIDAGERPTPPARRAARERLGLPQDAFVAGTVGRLDPVKSLHVLLTAHAGLLAKHPGARLVIVGDGPERAALQARAAALGLHDAVTFAGYRSDVRALMSAFDVYVNCSAYEGLSLTVLEAMAAALPVIATPAGGNPEVVVDHETGLLVPGHPGAIAEALSRLVIDAPLRRVMGEAGRWRVTRHFSIARMVNDYAAAYLGPRAAAAASAPMDAPPAADTMSVSDATRSIV